MRSPNVFCRRQRLGTLERLVQEFVSGAKARGLSQNTTLYDSRSVGKFLEFARKQGITALEGFNTALVRLSLGDCMSHLAPGGAHARFRSVRAFAGYLMAEELLTVNPFNKNPQPPLGLTARRLCGFTASRTSRQASPQTMPLG